MYNGGISSIFLLKVITTFWLTQSWWIYAGLNSRSWWRSKEGSGMGINKSREVWIRAASGHCHRCRCCSIYIYFHLCDDPAKARWIKARWRPINAKMLAGTPSNYPNTWGPAHSQPFNDSCVRCYPLQKQPKFNRAWSVATYGRKMCKVFSLPVLCKIMRMACPAPKRESVWRRLKSCRYVWVPVVKKKEIECQWNGLLPDAELMLGCMLSRTPGAIPYLVVIVEASSWL